MKQPASGELQQALDESCIRIRHASVEQIKEVLRLVMIKIGLRAQNWPTDEEKLVLIEHVVSNYGGHTIQEIRLAFDMAISGMLEVEVNAFENFSCLYFSNIMNAYRTWARQEVKQLPVIELPQSEEEEMTDDEFIEMNYRIWQTLGKVGMISTKCYSILVAQGKINLAQDEKDNMYESMERVLKSRVEIEKTAMANKKVYDNDLIKCCDSKEQWKARVFNECKKVAVENYFKSLLTNTEPAKDTNEYK